MLVAAVAVVAWSRQAPEAAPAVAPACLWRLVRALLMMMKKMVTMLCLFDPENEDDKTLSLFQEMDKHNVIFPVTIVVQDESYVNNPLVKRITTCNV